VSIKTSSAKGKGKKFQNYVRDRILARFPWLGEGDVESCSMGSGGVDIPLSPLGRRTFPISVECKKTKKTPSRAELDQARANAYGSTTPAVVWCPHGVGAKKAMIMFDLEDFFDFYERIAEDDLADLAEAARDVERMERNHRRVEPSNWAKGHE
jgi:hypothetical protein